MYSVFLIYILYLKYILCISNIYLYFKYLFCIQKRILYSNTYFMEYKYFPGSDSFTHPKITSMFIIMLLLLTSISWTVNGHCKRGVWISDVCIQPVVHGDGSWLDNVGKGCRWSAMTSHFNVVEFEEFNQIRETIYGSSKWIYAKVGCPEDSGSDRVFRCNLAI